MGRGVAYGTRLEAHVLNVPAAQMSLFPDDPEHFLRFAREKAPDLEAYSFVSRQLYGEYLESTLRDHAREADGKRSLTTMVGRALTVRVGENACDVVMDGGAKLTADRVVLALGNYSPANPSVETPEFYTSARYIRDPWVPGAFDVISSGERILLVGTGLTMMDIALDLSERDVARPICAMSRHGLLPQPHVSKPSLASPPSAISDGWPASARSYLREVRQRIRSHQENGGDWREVVGSLRSVTPELWQKLPDMERARFLRHLRPYWDVHRHRAAPVTAEAIDRKITDGHLHIRSGRILRYLSHDDRVEVFYQPRGSRHSERIEMSRVVNCTGPDSDLRRIDDPLLRSLMESGLLTPDPLGLGIATDSQGALIGAEGYPSSRLFLLGPLLKARDWECTAVPELRKHAALLARHLSE